MTVGAAMDASTIGLACVAEQAAVNYPTHMGKERIEADGSYILGTD
jgi:hypothetical protein